MQKFSQKFLLMITLGALLFQVQSVQAATIYCSCVPDTGNTEVLKKAPDPVCKDTTEVDCSSYKNFLESQGQTDLACLISKDLTGCKANLANWQKKKAKAIADLEQAQGIEQKQAASKQTQFLPACILADKLDLNSDCGDITIFIKLMLNIVSYLLSFVGGLALLFFIYGGFIWIFSGGSPEKITQGKEVVLSALLGLAVAFCGYVLVSFLGDAVGISSVYKLK